MSRLTCRQSSFQMVLKFNFRKLDFHKYNCRNFPSWVICPSCRSFLAAEHNCHRAEERNCLLVR